MKNEYIQKLQNSINHIETLIKTEKEFVNCLEKLGCEKFLISPSKMRIGECANLLIELQNISKWQILNKSFKKIN